MSRSTRSDEILRALCGEIGPDDGQREARHRGRHHSTKPDRKTWQLCAQAQRALEFVLADECPWVIRHSAYIHRVSPAPDATQFLVTICVREALAPAELGACHAELIRRAGRLRAAVASSITRKKAPALLFQIVPEVNE